MSGREQIPPRHDDDGHGEHTSHFGMPVPPATVAATHLAASAASLADATRAGSAGIADLGDLTDVLEQLLAAQRRLTDVLGNVAGRVDATPIDTADPEDVTALVEVLLAASTAAEHTAGALGHAGPIITALVESAGRDTRW